jgi:hypothetical protein
MRQRYIVNAAACALIVLLAVIAPALAGPTKITFDDNGVLEADGKKMFVLSFSTPPPPGGKTPEGADGWAELANGGVNFFRIAQEKDQPHGSPEAMEHLQACLDAAAAHHQLCWVTLGPLPKLKDESDKNAVLLRSIVERFKNHPALGAWKGLDEPAWGKQPPDQILNAYKLIHRLDPNHPVIVLHAPEKASRPLEDYMPACDVTGADIYPIGYPPGKHSDFGNREISIVADCTKWVVQAAHRKPVWMTLQVAWSGTGRPGKVLRFPTFAQERYMAYAATINGARGLNYFGPALPTTLSHRDAALGWNWTFWERVMRPLFEEFRYDSPLAPALIAPDSKLPVTVEGEGAGQIDWRAREVGNDIFVMAAKREGDTVKVHFSGLGPAVDGAADVLFEDPRTVDVKSGGFDDWFGPNEVHVYRIKRR